MKETKRKKVLKKCCGTCKYCYSDYVWDSEQEDEFEVFECSKHYRDEIEYDTEPCEKYKIYRPKPYIEKFSKCDLCEMKSYCISQGAIFIDITTLEDKNKHSIAGIDYICPKGERYKF